VLIRRRNRGIGLEPRPQYKKGWFGRHSHRAQIRPQGGSGLKRHTAPRFHGLEVTDPFAACKPARPRELATGEHRSWLRPKCRRYPGQHGHMTAGEERSTRRNFSRHCASTTGFRAGSRRRRLPPCGKWRGAARKKIVGTSARSSAPIASQTRRGGSVLALNVRSKAALQPPSLLAATRFWCTVTAMLELCESSRTISASCSIRLGVRHRHGRRRRRDIAVEEERTGIARSASSPGLKAADSGAFFRL